MSVTKTVALSIAGSDPSGGAGIQADLKTFHQFGVYGEAVITLITVQNTRGVERVECLAPDLVADQIRAVIGDIPPGAAKTGALGNRAIIEAVAGFAAGFPFPLVVDPVMVSKHGAALLEADAVDALKTLLLPHAFLLTPNLDEASLLSGEEVRDVGGNAALGREIGVARGARGAGERRPSGRRCYRRLVLPGRIPGVHCAADGDAQYAWDGLHAVGGDYGLCRYRVRPSGSGGKSQALCYRSDSEQSRIGSRGRAAGSPRGVLKLF